MTKEERSNLFLPGEEERKDYFFPDFDKTFGFFFKIKFIFLILTLFLSLFLKNETFSGHKPCHPWLRRAAIVSMWIEAFNVAASGGPETDWRFNATASSNRTGIIDPSQLIPPPLGNHGFTRTDYDRQHLLMRALLSLYSAGTPHPRYDFQPVDRE